MRPLFDPRDPLLHLRLATAVAGAIAILALYSVSGITQEPNPGVLVALLVGLGGQYVSHRLRGKSLWAIKAILAMGMLLLLWRYMANLIANLQDTRYPLAELLLYLAVMNSFDLPRRHNLRIAMMVSVILLVVTATLSRDMGFGAFLLAFMASALWWGHQDMLSELGARPEQKKATWKEARGLAPAGLLVLVGGLLLVLVAPRNEGGGFKQLPFSSMIALPSQLEAQVRNPAYPSGGSDAEAESRQVNPEAYYGFSEDLDLNFRGRLADTVALKVRSPRRQFWRGMAYDVFDGRRWRMSRPEDVTPLHSNPFTLPISPTMGGNALPDGLSGAEGAMPSGYSYNRRQITTVYIEKDQTNLILMPGYPAQLYFPTGMIMADPYDSYRSPVLLEKGMYYTVVSATPVQGDLKGRDPELPPPGKRQHLAIDLDPYLAVPVMSERTRQLAREITQGARGPRDRLGRLERHLEATYPYDLGIPPFPGRADQLDHFLFEAKRGYCEHFATALALMGREVGVPTRLVTGYLPGDFNPFTGFYEVKTSHAHAWVEAYLWGRGWVAFDPTPGFTGPMDEAPRLNLPVSDLARAMQAATGWLLGPIMAIALAVPIGMIVWLWRRPRRLGEASRAYLRLRALLGRIGKVDTEGLTPRELEKAVMRAEELKAIAPEAREIIRRYEEIRFGGSPDDGALAKAVTALSRRLRRARSR